MGSHGNRSTRDRVAFGSGTRESGILRLNYWVDQRGISDKVLGQRGCTRGYASDPLHSLALVV